MEQEKDRAQQIKLQETQFKNQQALENFRIKQEEARLKREGMTRKPITLPGGGLAEYVPGADGQPGTVNTILQPTVKPIAKSYTTMYGSDGTAYGVNRSDPSDVMVVKDPITGEPIKKVAGQTGKRQVTDAKGMPYLLDMEPGMLDPVEVPQGFAEKQPSAASGGISLKDWAAMQQRFYQQNISAKAASMMEFDPTAEMEAARLQTEQILGPKPMPGQGAPAQPSAPLAPSGGQPANPPMAREALVDGRPALIDEANSEFFWLDNAPAAAAPPANVQSSAPIAATTPPNVQMSFDVNNPAFSIQNGNPYLGPVAYPAPNAVPGSLSRNNYVPPPPRSLEEVVADANALKIKLAQERNANLPPVNNGQSLADLVNNGYTPPPPAPPREMGEFEKWMIDTGQTISREADAIMRSALTSVAANYRAGKNNAVFDDVARRLLDNNVPINVVRERFKQYPDVMNAVSAEYHKRTGRMLPID